MPGPPQIEVLALTPAAHLEEDRIAPLDLWRVHLEQCPECGRAHGCNGCPGGGLGGLRGPERHIYEYAQTVSEDLLCPLCCDVLQAPVQSPCTHHYCSECVRRLLMRTAGKVACPLDGQVLTRFALRPADKRVLQQLDDLHVRCPVCQEQVRKADLQLHLQDPVNMVESPEAYEAILRTFYMSCTLSNFTVGELNGTSSIVRFYRRLGEQAMQRFVFTSKDFLVLPDPKMGSQPHTDADFEEIRKHGGYFVAWWVHPAFRPEVWWRTEPPADPTAEAAGAGMDRDDAPSSRPQQAPRRRQADSPLLGSLDCSSEPWHASSFMHTWSSVAKPSSPKYLCCLRDLDGHHIPMLEAFRKSMLEWLKETYGVDESHVWMYCHYPSSARYSTLHFHIVFAGSVSSRYARYPQKADRPHQLSRQFALSQVIETLKRDPRHFETCTLCYYLGDKADLMDPISAYFGCSPHVYVKDFTFQWDPHAVREACGQSAPRQSQKSLDCGPVPLSPKQSRRDSFPVVQVRSLASDGGHAERAADTTTNDRLQLQFLEVMRSVGSLRTSVEELAKKVEEVHGGRRAEELGAARLALLQLAALPETGFGAPRPQAPHGHSSTLLLLTAAAGVAATFLGGWLLGTRLDRRR